MLIRSQDKRRLLVLENIYDIHITHGTVYAIGDCIGIYKNEEQAMRVLTEIQNSYVDGCKLYRMPQDSEV